ncbi:TonB-dependent receptor [Solimonas sp. K1W22B-7]|uniref:TonB-dependent receptor n=1 Tax=Solimonas sp. K1W22B-7 TaxID=2303331 RepID=UPI001968CC50|nr:TonB-dependent receptor [Solimonas sp. K1W22B-7]
MLDTIPVVSKPEPALTPPPEPAHRQIEEIIVTAQKREERLQDVPVSVTAISGDDLRDKNAKGLGDVAVPNMELSSDGLLSQFFVRGIGSNFEQPIERSIVLFIDDIAYTDRVTALSSFLDIDRVEFLRGPQGTLFGKNTVAGAISMYTRKPVLDDWQGRLSAAWGNLGDRAIDGAVNIPVLEDRMALRLAGTFEEREGYVDNSYRGEMDGDKYNYALSARALVNLEDAGELLMGARYGVSRQDNGPPSQASKDPGTGLPGLSPFAVFDPAYETKIDHHSSKDLDEYLDGSGWSANAQYRLDLPAGYSLTSLFAYTESSFTTLADEGTPAPLTSIFTDATTSGYQGELRISSPPDLFDGRFNFLGGLYGSWDNEDIIADVDLVPVGGLLQSVVHIVLPGFTLPGLDQFPGNAANAGAQSVYVDRDRDVTTLAGFAQGTLKLTDSFDLILGARYSWVQTHLNLLDLQYTALGLEGVPSLFNLLGLQNFEVRGRERNDVSPTGKLSLRYHFSDDEMVFATVAQGFKAGGYSPGNPGPDFSGYEPETSLLYELGAKLSLFDSRMRVNATAFRTEFKNFQVLVQENFVDVVTNAAQAETAGAELETLTILPLGLTLGVNGSWMPVARFVSYPDGPCAESTLSTQTSGCDRSGGRLPYAPEWSASVGLSGFWPLPGQLFALNAGVDGSWSDSLFFQADGDPVDSREALWRVNARAGFGTVDNQWSLQLFVNNLTNAVWQEYGNDTTAGGHFAYVPPPRTWNLRLSWNF